MHIKPLEVLSRSVVLSGMARSLVMQSFTALLVMVAANYCIISGCCLSTLKVSKAADDHSCCPNSKSKRSDSSKECTKCVSLVAFHEQSPSFNFAPTLVLDSSKLLTIASLSLDNALQDSRHFGKFLSYKMPDNPSRILIRNSVVPTAPPVLL